MSGRLLTAMIEDCHLVAVAPLAHYKTVDRCLDEAGAAL